MKKLLKILNANSILKSSSGLLAITLLAKVLGYIEKLCLANYFGTSYLVDSYTVVFTIVFSLFLFFREVVEPGFLNVFLDTSINGNETVSWNLFNKGFRLILFITLMISLISILFPEKVIHFFAPGFDGEKLKLSTKLISIVIPACIFLSLSTLTSITLNGLKLFVLPASGDLVFKGLIIICLILFYNNYGISGAAIGILIGSFGRLCVHLTKLFKKISFKKIKIERKYKYRIWHLTWPLLIGVVFSQISSIVDNVFASYMQEGAIAALSYAKKIVELPVVIFPYVISIVIFPYFSQLVIEKKKEKLNVLFSSSLKWIIIAFLPIAAIFIIYPEPIVEIIFQRGAFDANSTILTSKPFMIYSLGLVFFAIETILVIFYYANADTKTPVFIGIGCVILNIILTWVFIQIMGYIGIALAYVVQKTIKNLILLYLVKRKISFCNKNLKTFILKTIISFSVFVAVIFISKILLFDEINYSIYIKIAFIVLNAFIAGGLYLIFLQKLDVLRIKSLTWIQNEKDI